jgi:hypothetical protein
MYCLIGEDRPSLELTALCYRMRLQLPALISMRRLPNSFLRDAGLYQDTRYISIYSLSLEICTNRLIGEIRRPFDTVDGPLAPFLCSMY